MAKDAHGIEVGSDGTCRAGGCPNMALFIAYWEEERSTRAYCNRHYRIRVNNDGFKPAGYYPPMSDMEADWDE